MSAYDELYRRHVDEATRVARIVTGNADDAAELVNEAFTRVLSRLSDGGGPDDDLGPYLRTVVRRLAVDRYHGRKRHTCADPDTLDVLPTADDPIGRADDKHLVRTAFETLPERWQRVLWHTEIEGRSPASLASALGMAPNAVAALAYRAREGLRQAYLTVNLPRAVAPECRGFSQKLPAYARGTLNVAAAAEVAEHLQTCGACRERRDELLLLASNLRGILAPALLLPATGWTAAAVAGGAAAAGGAATGGLLSWLTPTKWAAASGGSGIAAAGAAGGGLAAALATVAVLSTPFGGSAVEPQAASHPAEAPSMSIEGPLTTGNGNDAGNRVASDRDGRDEADRSNADGPRTDSRRSESGEPDDSPSAPDPAPDPGDSSDPEPESPDPESPEPIDTPDPSEPADPIDPEPVPSPEPEDPIIIEPIVPLPPEPDPEPEPSPDQKDEAVNISVDLGLDDLLGIEADLGLGGIIGVEIR